MKTKNVKKLALTCLATAFLACGSIGLVVADFETSAATDSIGSFEMVGGASIRTVSGTTGIRYTAKFDETLYNVVTEDDDKQFGMIITKLDYYLQAKAANSDLIAGLDSLGANKYVLISESSANPCTPYLYTFPSGETEYRVSGALTNIKYSNADSTWMGVGVVITGNGDEQDTYEYAKTDETNARTTAYVATAALNDEAFGYKDYEKDVMRDYVYEYTAKVSGLDEATFDAQEDKSANLNGLTIALGDGIDTTEKYNQNVAGKETYLTINEKQKVNIAVTTADGKALDFACETSSSDSDVVKVENFNELKPLKNGYATLTVSSTALGDWSETVTAYVGSESVVKMTETSIRQWSGAQTGYHSTSATGSIKGVNYYGYVGRGTASETVQYAAYSDTLSVYYIDYMIAQGYTHIRMPFYFDTSLTHELFEGVDESNRKTSQTIRSQLAPAMGGGSFTDTKIDLDEWIYWDVDINHYRAHFAEADNAAVDTYGVKTGITDRWYYVNGLFMSMKNTLAYLGEQTFVKGNDYAVVADTETTATFGELIDLNDIYTSNIALSYEYDGVPHNNILATVTGETSITVNGNVYAQTLNDSKKVVVTKSEGVEKTLKVTVSDGVKAVNLVDVNGKDTAVDMDNYTRTAELETLGFTVSQSYKKRYADTNYEQAATIANTERGIFYANVMAEKDGEKYTYSTTIDVYNSNEPVEYESFGHDDSDYAYRVYFAASEWKNTAKDYETLIKNYNSEKGNGAELKTGTAPEVSDGCLYGYLTRSQYTKANDKASGNASTSNTNIATIYGSSENIWVLEINQANIDWSTPFTISSTNSGAAYIHIYVMPRHTQEYYAYFAETNTNTMKFSDSSGWSKGSCTSRVITSITNGTASYTSKQRGSANMQQNLWSQCTITLQDIANNYDLFAEMKIHIYSSQDPQGFNTTYNNGVARLSSLLF
ncbi:MAG: hypothetical protein IJA89_08055 [Clostridia bacterium]|nr:hypothetical protein [Clostridia bacterium]